MPSVACLFALQYSYASDDMKLHGAIESMSLE